MGIYSGEDERMFRSNLNVLFNERKYAMITDVDAVAAGLCRYCDFETTGQPA
jgi:hypothetical protein